MIENYRINADGLIYQVERTPFVYDKSYALAYDKLGELNTYMSYLRMGWVQGTVPDRIINIMDVGYGNGAFLKLCTKTFSESFGYDITGYSVPKGATFVENWLSHPVEVATFFDVIEHLPDPYILKELKAKYIVGSVPWCHNFDDNWFKEWKHRKSNEHLWFFDIGSIRKFARAIGYEVIHSGYPEDVIRGDNTGIPNILSFTMRKKL